MPAGQITKTPENIPPLFILVAEDDPSNQIIIQHVLEEAGHHVVMVGNGVQAVEAAQSTRYDLILMDIHMPEMDGTVAAKIIRKSRRCASAATPIIAVTANRLAGDREHYMARGMDEYVTKPIDPHALFATMGAVLGLSGLDLQPA